MRTERLVPALFTIIALLAAALAAGALTAPPAAAGPVPGVPTIALDPVATGFSRPLLVTHAGDGSDRLFVVEQGGVVKTMDTAGNVDPVPWLDIRSKVRSTGNEQGLLGLAFHPDFATNGVFLVSYTGLGGESVLARYDLADPLADRPDPNAGTVLLTVAQPYSNHNGGHIAFGPDGYLYYGLGDGGSGGDPMGNGQNPHTLLGALLRLDVTAPTYAIPADNPFADGVDGAPEVWAFGLRNPWRFTFDRATGDLLIGDVGQNLMEEINHEPAGAAGGRNYGWGTWEGSLPYRASTSVLDVADKTFPVLEYAHNGLHCSVTGGHVYRGPSVPDLEGWYVYADYCSGIVWGTPVWQARSVGVELLVTSFGVTSFGEDEAGDLYVVYQTGTIYRVAEA